MFTTCIGTKYWGLVLIFLCAEHLVQLWIQWSISCSMVLHAWLGKIGWLDWDIFWDGPDFAKEKFWDIWTFNLRDRQAWVLMLVKKISQKGKGKILDPLWRLSVCDTQSICQNTFVGLDLWPRWTVLIETTSCTILKVILLMTSNFWLVTLHCSQKSMVFFFSLWQKNQRGFFPQSRTEWTEFMMKTCK